MAAQLKRPGPPSKGVLIRGVVGQIKWSYYVAATLEGYSVRRDKTSGVWSLTGRVVTADAFKMRQRPLVFMAPTKHGNWEWEMVSHEVRNGTVTATLAPFQEWI